MSNDDRSYDPLEVAELALCFAAEEAARSDTIAGRLQATGLRKAVGIVAALRLPGSAICEQVEAEACAYEGSRRNGFLPSLPSQAAVEPRAVA